MHVLDRSFLFVTGKGGVGKTTVAAALGRALAQQGRRVLLALTSDGSAAELLGTATIPADHIAQVTRGLFVTLIEPEVALREYGSMVLRSKVAYAALFGNRYSQTFFSGVPGLYQWATLGKAWFHSEERDSKGEARFDVVILDAPATGHALEMLRVPLLITKVAPKGLLRRDADLALGKLRDSARSGVVVVSLAEELAVSESLQLVSELAALELPVASLILNAMARPLFQESDAATLKVATERAGALAAPLLGVVLDRAEREASEAQQAARLSAAVAPPVFRLPWSSAAALGKPDDALVAALAASLQS
jgi:anion-transporting  ArsA/GET3 family ATPase